MREARIHGRRMITVPVTALAIESQQNQFLCAPHNREADRLVSAVGTLMNDAARFRKARRANAADRIDERRAALQLRPHLTRLEYRRCLRKILVPPVAVATVKHVREGRAAKGRIYRDDAPPGPERPPALHSKTLLLGQTFAACQNRDREILPVVMIPGRHRFGHLRRRGRAFQTFGDAGPLPYVRLVGIGFPKLSAGRNRPDRRRYVLQRAHFNHRRRTTSAEGIEGRSALLPLRPRMTKSRQDLDVPGTSLLSHWAIHPEPSWLTISKRW